jgi:hypothetical protein
MRKTMVNKSYNERNIPKMNDEIITKTHCKKISINYSKMNRLKKIYRGQEYSLENMFKEILVSKENQNDKILEICFPKKYGSNFVINIKNVLYLAINTPEKNLILSNLIKDNFNKMITKSILNLDKINSVNTEFASNIKKIKNNNITTTRYFIKGKEQKK